MDGVGAPRRLETGAAFLIMKRAISFLMAAVISFTAQAAHVLVDFGDFGLTSLTNRNTTLTLQGTNIVSGQLISREAKEKKTGSDGRAYYSNSIAGLYKLELASTPITVFWLNIPDTNGVVSAAACAVPSTNAPGNLVGYSQTQADARFLPIPTNNATASNGQVVSKTGDKTKYIDAGEASLSAEQQAILDLAKTNTVAGNNVTVSQTDHGSTINADVSLAAVAVKVDTNETRKVTLSNTNNALYAKALYLTADGTNFYAFTNDATGTLHIIKDPIGSADIYMNASLEVEQGIVSHGGLDSPSILSLGNIEAHGTFHGNGNGITNASPALATNNATATDGMALVKRGDKLKLETISGSGTGIGTLSGTGTNTTLKTTDNTSDPSGAALIVRPMVLPTSAGGAASLLEMWPAITNGAYFPRNRHVAYSAAQAYGSDQPDIIFAELLNYGGNSSGVSSYGPTTTNYPGWIHHRELKWQNNATYTQLEDWYGWATPFTQWGTNWSGRFMGFDLVWKTSDSTYYSTDGNITVDSFSLFSPGSSVGSINFLPAQTDYGPSYMYIYGTVTARTNTSGGSGFVTEGGNFQAKVPTGVTASTTQIGMDWNNNIGVKPHFYTYHFGGPAAYIITGFTNWELSERLLKLTNNVSIEVGGNQTNKSTVVWTNAAAANGVFAIWNGAYLRITNPASANAFVTISPAGITNSSLTASRAMVTDANGADATSTVTATELGYLSGVASGLQAQLDAKVPATAFNANQFSVGGSATNIKSGALVTNMIAKTGLQLVNNANDHDVTLAWVDAGVLGISSAADAWTGMYLASTGIVATALHTSGKIGSGALTASRVAVSDSNKDLASVADSSGAPINSAGSAVTSFTGSFTGDAQLLTNNFNFKFPTNTVGTVVAFAFTNDICRRELTTNATFQFLAPVNVSTTNYQSVTIWVTNSAASTINVIAPANVFTNGGGAWNVTNGGMTAFSFYNFHGNLTNALAFPIK